MIESNGKVSCRFAASTNKSTHTDTPSTMCLPRAKKAARESFIIKAVVGVGIGLCGLVCIQYRFLEKSTWCREKESDHLIMFIHGYVIYPCSGYFVSKSDLMSAMLLGGTLMAADYGQTGRRNWN